MQSDKSDLIIYISKEAEAHKDRSCWKLKKNSEVRNKHKDKYGKLKTILSIWYFNHNRLPDGIIMKQESKLCSHGVIQQLGVEYWEPYAPVENWICVRSRLVISSIHELPSKSIGFVFVFTQADLAADVFVDLLLGWELIEIE